MSDTLLIDWQSDLRDRLLGDPVLTNVTIRSEDDLNVLADLGQNLSTMTSRNGKTGAAIIVLEPEATESNENSLFGPFDMHVRFLVMENVPLNRDATTGTLLNATTIAQRIYRVMKLYQNVAIATPLRPEAKWLVTNRTFKDLKVKEVRFMARSSDPTQYLKVAFPSISPALGAAPQTVTLACTTAGAAIYYTTNGNHPLVGGAGVSLYAAPFAVNSPATLKVAAIKTGSIESDLNAAIYT